MGKIDVYEVTTCDIRTEILSAVDQKFALAWKVIRKSRWTKGFNCRRCSRTFGSWRY